MSIRFVNDRHFFHKHSSSTAHSDGGRGACIFSEQPTRGMHQKKLSAQQTRKTTPHTPSLCFCLFLGGVINRGAQKWLASAIQFRCSADTLEVLWSKELLQMLARLQRASENCSGGRNNLILAYLKSMLLDQVRSLGFVAAHLLIYLFPCIGENYHCL